MSNQLTVRILSQYTVACVIVREHEKPGSPDETFADMPAGTNEHNALDRIPLDFRNGAMYSSKVIGPKDAATLLVVRSAPHGDLDWKGIDLAMDAMSTHYGEPPVPGRLFGNLIHDSRPYTQVEL